MKPIIPKINVDGARVSSFLYRGKSPEYLTQDQLTVALPNGYYIDVSWFPEHDPSGTYIIRVFWEFADNQRFEIKTADFNEMLSAIEFLAAQFSRLQIPVAASSESFKEVTIAA